MLLLLFSICPALDIGTECVNKLSMQIKIKHILKEWQCLACNRFKGPGEKTPQKNSETCIVCGDI